MKKVALLSLSLVFISTLFARNADEVINKFIEASGGRQKLNSINTLHYNQLIKVKSPMGDLDIPLEFFKEKNKFYRMQASIQFGPQSIEMFTVITDTGGFVMLPANPMTGSAGGIQKMDVKDVQSQAYQLDAAGMFAALVDYSSKGHKAELLKEDKVNNEDCYKLKVTLKSGQEIVYYLNKTTNLVARVETKGSMAASMSGFGAMMGGMGGSSGMEKMEVTTDYKDYKEVEGVKFPTKILIKSQMGDTESELSNIEVNKPIDAKWYKAA